MAPKPLQLGNYCRAGHLLTEDNTYTEGVRLRCKDCLRARRPLKGKQQKTHCPHGHEYTDENTYWYNGYRACKTCRKTRVYETREPGVGQGGVNAAKTHCPHGHEYAEENTYVTLAGSRTCRTCARENASIQVIKKYGLTVEQYDELYQQQNGQCAICNIELISLTKKEVQIDHDHSCCDYDGSCGQCIRGILCGECNRGLERFKDDATLLRQAANYLDSKECSR